MKTLLNLTFFSCALFSWAVLPALSTANAAQDEKAAETKTAEATEATETAEVKVKDITLVIPKSWKQTPVKSSMRAGQFSIPAAKDDKADGELVIFHFGAGGAGTVSANVKRWIGQFAEGRTVSAFQGNSKVGRYMLLDVVGTYNKPIGPPIAGKTEMTPGTRMLAVIIDVKEKGPYFVKLTGPKKTIEAAAKDFRKTFGSIAADEKELKVEL